MQHKSKREREDVQMVTMAQTQRGWEGYICGGGRLKTEQPATFPDGLSTDLWKLSGSVGNEDRVTAAECGSGVVLKLQQHNYTEVTTPFPNFIPKGVTSPGILYQSPFEVPGLNNSCST
uniref:Uncharacterized protein n=1 Tax=Micrurus lemniscatus lemniscatus TaxID=129467 RepID=A0A2D4JPQ1_MICLE